MVISVHQLIGNTLVDDSKPINSIEEEMIADYHTICEALEIEAIPIEFSRRKNNGSYCQWQYRKERIPFTMDYRRIYIKALKVVLGMKNRKTFPRSEIIHEAFHIISPQHRGIYNTHENKDILSPMIEKLIFGENKVYQLPKYESLVQ